MVWALVLALAQAPLSARVSIDLSQPTRPIQPWTAGHNVEAADSFGIFGDQHSQNAVTGEGFWDPGLRQPQPKAVALAKQIGVTLLRYPGGCLGHGFDWKQYVGPLAQRSDKPFGLMEFLEVCRAVGAEPLITTGDYAASSEDNGHLAEFLNAPAVPKYPWAMKRAAWGHPRPYGVKLFELGNETDHGNHQIQPFQRWTAEQYVAWAGDSMRRIRAIDPKAKVGAHLGTSFPNVDDPWNEVVARALGKSVDFFVVHPYGVRLYEPPANAPLDEDLLMQAAMAEGEQFEAALRRYREKIAGWAGRAVPLAATEYNAMYVQEKPKPYRFSLAGALFASDFRRVLMDPKNVMLTANYWQFLNGYWGMALGSETDGYRKQAAFPMYELWAKHFGPKWATCRVASSPKLEFPGTFGAGTQTARGEFHQMVEQSMDRNLFSSSVFTPVESQGFRSAQVGDRFTAEFQTPGSEVHQPFGHIQGKPGWGYRIRFQAKSSGSIEGSKLGLSCIDGRGWEATRSGTAAEGAETASDWKEFEAKFHAAPECPGIQLAWRIIPTKEGARGTLEIRNLRVEPFLPVRFPAYAAVTSAASISADGKKLHVMLFNKHATTPIRTTIDILGAKLGSGSMRTVSGPSMTSTNLESETVKVSPPRAVVVKGGQAVVALPPRSMNSIDFPLVRK